MKAFDFIVPSQVEETGNAFAGPEKRKLQVCLKLFFAFLFLILRLSSLEPWKSLLRIKQLECICKCTNRLKLENPQRHKLATSFPRKRLHEDPMAKVHPRFSPNFGHANFVPAIILMVVCFICIMKDQDISIKFYGVIGSFQIWKLSSLNNDSNKGKLVVWGPGGLGFWRCP